MHSSSTESFPAQDRSLGEFLMQVARHSSWSTWHFVMQGLKVQICSGEVFVAGMSNSLCALCFFVLAFLMQDTCTCNP